VLTVTLQGVESAVYDCRVVTVAGPSSDAVLREQSKRGQSCLGVFLLIFSIFLIAVTFPVAICLSLKVHMFASRLVTIRSNLKL